MWLRCSTRGTAISNTKTRMSMTCLQQSSIMPRDPLRLRKSGHNETFLQLTSSRLTNCLPWQPRDSFHTWGAQASGVRLLRKWSAETGWHTNAFYQKNWNTVSGDLLGMMNEFHAGGNLRRSTTLKFFLSRNRTKLLKLGEFRPISMANYANWLRDIVEDMISDSRAALIKGTSILDSVVVGQ